jgi:hypothetical protein
MLNITRAADVELLAARRGAFAVILGRTTDLARHREHGHGRALDRRDARKTIGLRPLGRRIAATHRIVRA